MPPDLQQLLAAVRRAQQDGMAPEQIQSSIQNLTGGQIGSVPDLIRAATQPAAATYRGETIQPDDERAAALQRTGDFGLGNAARMFLQGATLNTADEIRGLASGAVAAILGEKSPREAYREGVEAERSAVQDLRTAYPVASNVAELTSMFSPAGALLKASHVGRLGKALSSGPVRTAREAIEAAVRAPTRGATIHAGRRAVRELAGGAARGAGLGAVFGGIQAAGAADGENVVQEGLRGAGVGGLLGGAVGLASRAPKAFGEFVQDRRLRVEHVNDRIARQGRELLEGSRSGRAVLEDVAQRRRLAQEGFRAIEDQIMALDDDVQQALRSDAVKDAFEVSPRLRRLTGQALNAEAPTTVGELQRLTGQMQDDINKLYRGGDGKLATELVQEKRVLMNAIDSSFEEAPELRRLWRQTTVIPDALNSGRSAGRLSGRELQETLEAFTDPEAKQAFRIGLLEDIVDDLEGRSGQVRLTQQVRDKLAAATDSPQMFDDFLRVVESETAELRRMKLEEAILKYGGFMFLGSSIAGSILLGG